MKTTFIKLKINFIEENTNLDIDELNDFIGNLHLYCYEPEKDASELSRSNSDTNEYESSKEEKVSRNNTEINIAGQKYWVICGN